MTDRRRHQGLMRDFMLPVIVSVVTGVGASFVSAQMAVKVLETKVQYIESDMKAITDITGTLNDVQMELTRRGQWMVTTDRKLDRQDRKLELLLEELQQERIYRAAN